jgi:hypothetical protein
VYGYGDLDPKSWLQISTVAPRFIANNSNRLMDQIFADLGDDEDQPNEA